MRTVSATWESNQAEDASHPSRLSAVLETRKSDTILRQVAGSLVGDHPGEPTSYADDFNRANGDLGSDWATVVGTPQVNSNQFYALSGLAKYVPTGDTVNSAVISASINAVYKCLCWGIIENSYHRARVIVDGTPQIVVEEILNGSISAELARKEAPSIVTMTTLIVSFDGTSAEISTNVEAWEPLSVSTPDRIGGAIGLGTAGSAFIDNWHADTGGVVGQTMLFPESFVVTGLVFRGSLTSWTSGDLSMELWTYDDDLNELVSLVTTGTATVTGNFSNAEVEFTLADPLTVAEATNYAAVILSAPSGSLSLNYAIGNRYENGSRITGTDHQVGQVMTERTGEDLYFRVVGNYPSDMPKVRRWRITNDPDVDNAVEASFTSTFDPSAVTLPVESCTFKITNGLVADEYDEDYDFTLAANKLALKAPGNIDVKLGYFYPTSSDSVPITRQRVEKSELTEDELYASFETVSFTSRLDEFVFYGGRYDANGIPVSTLFAEVLEDAQFPEEGGWRYRIGDAACKVGAGSLWTSSGYSYYTIDPALDSILIYVPIPPVTHREALSMLAAYSGAHLIHRSDGSLDVVAALDAKLDYHLDIDRIYDRPESSQGAEIGKLTGKLRSYSKADATSEILNTTVLVEDLNATEFRITHDACEGTALDLTGATLVGDPVYNTYSTVFTAVPEATSFQAVLTGYAVQINEVDFTRTYSNEHGEVRTYDNPIASDIDLTYAMCDRYKSVEAATKYTFTMRDDAAVEVADRVKLDTLAVPTGSDVIVTDIKRSFNGGVEAEYTVIDDPF